MEITDCVLSDWQRCRPRGAVLPASGLSELRGSNLLSPAAVMESVHRQQKSLDEASPAQCGEKNLTATQVICPVDGCRRQ
ncbi:hypothetical protein AK812_SmicGene22187 [Symbiodinium microadriaticum]|uniref:Uncharacterized protein n=1 Tax=Symbiodinium microadriaticum TaxID=2951 RepID=A0A1Q9DKG9_SYMMI|nr:hypothetical protein AK812_SmicGene22187 [Symbiodinium microadriaticum]